ncbi:MAG: sigma 54-interacting transcriptional regulator [Deltaproteobacteria bacterium]|nr:sigma 54-interacting transcriptional regulator [Deltaproteobacteria bacterium]
MALDERDLSRAVLLAVGDLLGREVALDELLGRMVARIAQALHADRGTIYLVDRATDTLVSRAAHLPELEEIRLRLGQGVAGYVGQTGQVVNVPTSRTDARFYPGVDDQTGYRTESILAVPMRDRRGEIIGVVQLLNKVGGAFTEGDAEALVELAAQASVALEATTVYPELSRPDPLEQSELPLAGHFNGIVGRSEALRRACRITARAAASEATVLIRGESGTGKELFARAIHVNSPREAGPFVKVDCASLPESLIENELFGHEKGAFTGADKRAEGKFDLAAGGTIFLDEIGELPPSMQGKLLRVLQDREFDRVGGSEPVRADVRVVAATNRDLEEMVNAGRFRGDLYFRIRVVEVELPALRTRGPQDIRRLVEHFARTAARRHGRPLPRITEDAYLRLLSYPWPGNVRELENCVESAVVIMEADVITAADLPLPERPVDLGALHGRKLPGIPFGDTVPRAPLPRAVSSGGVATLEAVERAHIMDVLAQAGGNRTQAAKLLGIGRNTLTRKLQRYGVADEDEG